MPAIKSRLVSIDVLRGLAVVAVVAIHVPHHAPGGWRQNPLFLLSFLFDFGYLGVPLFVVISGFCIHRSVALQNRSGVSRLNWAQFWKRRFWRLYPPYVAAIAFSLFLAFALHDRFVFDYRSAGPDLLAHILLIHNLTSEYAVSMGNGAFWSLGMEEQLYALYFVLFLMLSRGHHRYAIAVVAAATLGWRAATALLIDQTVSIPGFFTLGTWYQWPFAYWLHWSLGAYAADAYYGNLRIPGWCRSAIPGITFGLLGFAVNRNTFELLGHTSISTWPAVEWLTGFASPSLQLGFHLLGESFFAVAFFILLNWALRLENRKPIQHLAAKVMAAIGQRSYSIYLTHVPVLYTCEFWYPLGFRPAEWLLRYLLYGTAILLVGWCFFSLVERRFLAGQGSSRLPSPCPIQLAPTSTSCASDGNTPNRETVGTGPHP